MHDNILITEPIDAAGVSYLTSRGYAIKWGSGISEAVVAKEIQGCDAILTRNAVITEKIMRASKSLKVIAMHGVGVDNIDVEAATRLGIQVTNAAGSNAISVAEYTIGLLLDLSRHICVYSAQLKQGNWGVRSHIGADLCGKKLGIIGMGAIGSLVAQKASAGFGMHVLGYSRRKRPDTEYAQITTDLETVVRQADFLTLHVPSVPATRGMIDACILSMMKPEAFLINTARGEVVDEHALIRALKEKKLAGAAVDVFQGEIPPLDHPLFQMPNVIATPHTAAFTTESIARMALYAAIGVDEVLSGKPISHPVNHPKKITDPSAVMQDEAHLVYACVQAH